MMTKREEIVSIMRSWIGQRISDGTPSPIIDLYNTQKPLPRGWKVRYTDPACATTVSAAAMKASIPATIIPRECSCAEMIQLLKKIGAWQEDDRYIPEPGDIIFYDWDDAATGYATTDNAGAPEHVGIVECVAGGQITVIEGNKGKAVGRRMVSVNGRFIRGYGVPKYPDDTTKQEDDTVTQDQFEAMYKTMTDKWDNLGVADNRAPEDFEAAKAAGLTDGSRPQSLATRQEVAVMAYRAYKTTLAGVQAAAEKALR